MGRTLSSIPYHSPDQARLKRSLLRAHEAHEGAADARDSSELLASLRELERSLSSLMSALRLAELRVQEAGAQQAYYQSEIDRLQPLEDELKTARQKLYAPLLHSRDLAMVARQTGPLFLYRRQNDELFNGAEPGEQAGAASINTDDTMTKELTEVLTAPAPRASGPAIPLEVFLDEAISERSDYASRYGFSNFNEVAWLLRERFDYGLADAEQLRKQIVTYFVPIAYAYRSYWSQEPKALFFPDLEERHYHRSPVFHSKASLQELAEHFAAAWPAIDLNHVILDLDREGGAVTELKRTPLEGGRTILLQGSLGYSHRDIHELWRSLADIMVHQTLTKSSWLSENRRPTPAIQSAIRESTALLMALDSSAIPIWGTEAASCLLQQMIWDRFFKLMGCAMLDDYEDRLYNHPHYSITERRDLWTQVAGQYWPGTVSQYDYSFFPWRYGTTIKEFLNHPAGSRHDELMGILVAFQCLDLEQQKAGTGYDACANLIADSGRFPFRSLQDISGLPALFRDECLKRLAYQIAFALGL